MKSPLWHLATAHGWRQMWLFGMHNEEAERVHASRYPDCEPPESGAQSDAGSRSRAVAASEDSDESERP